MAEIDLRLARAYFEKKVKETDRSKCWTWSGTFQTRCSPGRVTSRIPTAFIKGKHHPARTISWWLDGGMMSDGPFRVTCRNELCVNPDHLEPCKRSHKGADRDFVERLEYGFYLNGLSEDDDG